MCTAVYYSCEIWHSVLNIQTVLLLDSQLKDPMGVSSSLSSSSSSFNPNSSSSNSTSSMSHSSSSWPFNRSAAMKGGEWEGKIHLKLEINLESKKKVMESEIKDFFDKNIDDDELITEIRVYKSKLYRLQGYHLFLNHQFVTLKTSAGWCWTIEKNTKGITFERNKVLNYNTSTEMTCDKSTKKLKDLATYLSANEESKKTYNIFGENCQNFAKRIFDEFADFKKHSINFLCYYLGF